MHIIWVGFTNEHVYTKYMYENIWWLAAIPIVVDYWNVFTLNYATATVGMRVHQFNTCTSIVSPVWILLQVTFTPLCMKVVETTQSIDAIACLKSSEALMRANNGENYSTIQRFWERTEGAFSLMVLHKTCPLWELLVKPCLKCTYDYFLSTESATSLLRMKNLHLIISSSSRQLQLDGDIRVSVVSDIIGLLIHSSMM